MREMGPASARWTVMICTLAAISIAGVCSAQAQTPWTPPGETPAAVAPKASKAAAAAAPTTAATPDDLPWLATTKPGDTGVDKLVDSKSADTPSPSSGAPTTAEKSPAGSVSAKKTANLPPKCEEQPEDGCRSLKSCAWVAAIPLGDGSIAPARCAERKAFAPEKKSKPAVATKPKPKPDSAASSKSEPAPAAAAAKLEPKSGPKPEAKSETAAIPATTKSDAAPAPAAPPAQAEPVKVETPPTDTKPEKSLSEAAKAEPAATEPAKTEAAKAQSPMMVPRAPVPFLPPDQPGTNAPATQSPQTDATPAGPASGDKVASDDATEAKQPLSIPGLVITE